MTSHPEVAFNHEDRARLVLCEAAFIRILQNEEKIMSTLQDMADALTSIDSGVKAVGTDVDTLVAKLTAIPTTGLTPAQQTALDAAVVHAQAISTSLKAIDAKANAGGTTTASGAPTVTSVSPATGPIAGGTSVTITGTGFSGTTAVTVGGASASAVTVSSDTSMTATVPAGVVGPASVLVTTPKGVNAPNTLFTYS
jgi:hypothetical protein